MVVMMVMIMRRHSFETAMTALGLHRVSALASSMANILTPKYPRVVLGFKTPSIVYGHRTQGWVCSYICPWLGCFSLLGGTMPFIRK